MKQAIYKIRTQNNAFGCTIKVANDFCFATRTQCGFESETICYAAYRFLKRSPELKDPLIREAVKLGLSLGKNKPRKHVTLTTAEKMELPGGRARLHVSVGQGEIVIKKLTIENRRTQEWSDIDLELAHNYSSNHKPELERDSLCGCFYCGKIFSPSKIHQWIIAETPIDYRGTAICPYCGIDSVIGESSGYPITRPFLKRMSQKWFGFTPAGCELEPEGSIKDKIDESSTVTDVCFDIRTDLNTPSAHSVDAYEALLMLQRQMIEPNGRKSPMMEEFSSEQFDCDEDRSRYLKEDVVPRAYKMAAILTRNYRKYIEMAELDSEAVIKDLAGRYIDAWLNNTDLNLNGEFDYYENAGLIQSEFDDV